MAKILIIDDNQTFLDSLCGHINENYPALQVRTCNDPLKSLAMITPDLDLLLLDLEMPGMDGGKLLNFAVERGVPKGRIIILSGRDADYLHEKFPMGECLAVLNKNEAKQQSVFNMILAALQQK
ncbi:MAG TPA: response regulator [Malonomonas sp.]